MNYDNNQFKITKKQRISLNIFLLIILIFAGYLSSIQTLKADKIKEKWDNILMNIDINDVNHIVIIDDAHTKRSIVLNVEKSKLNDFIKYLKEYDYGIASHPTSLNSKSFKLYINLQNSDDLSLYCTIMNNKDVVYFSFIGVNSNNYYSESLYYYIIENNLYPLD